MTTFISFIIVLGVLIFIHELGHFVVAKLSGVGVEKFSLGFGPKLLSVKKGETEYRISILPLGGYVKMVGESPDEDVSETDFKKSFTHRPVGTRAAIVASGPLMNLVLAAVLLPVIFMLGIKVPAYLERPAEVGFVAPGENAEKAGIKKGDIIESVDDKKTKNWEELLSLLSLNPGKSSVLEVVRGDKEIKIDFVTATAPDTGGSIIGMYPPMMPVIGEVSKGYPAKEAGLKPGDVILSVNVAPITHWAELETIVHKDGLKKSFLIKRGDKELTVDVTPRYNKDMKVYLVGITRKDEQIFRRYGFFDAIGKGLNLAVDMTGRLFVVIKGLVLGQYSLKTLGGPLMIAQVAGKAAETGLTDFLSLVAFLSLQLGIINLFPIPVLDGGHLLFFGIESIKGKPLSEKFMGIAQQIGIALLIALMVFVTYNDIFRLFG
jgi:regulator of sigma E protease